jgi:hypothetical protein
LVQRDDVLTLVEAGVAYDEVGRRLGIHPGLAYMIATGLPADGGDARSQDERDRPGYIATSTQYLANPELAENPTHHDEVAQWVLARVGRDPQMRAAGRRARPVPPELGSTEHGADLVAVIGRDHNALHKLANRLKYAPTAAAGATDDQIAERVAAVDALRVGLQRHEAAEERYVWPLVRLRIADGEAMAAAAQRQEQHGHELLRALAHATPGSHQFDAFVEQLQHALRSHVAYEDQILLALVDATEAEERAAVGEALARAERSDDGAS